MKKFFKAYGLLVIIFCIGFALRTYHISSVPPSPSLDEVSIGYNAYSILKTGKDEYKTAFPLLLRAYDDYRPALYVYFVIPFVYLLGLSAAAVRLPSVLLSSLSILAVYGIVLTLFHKKEYEWSIKGYRIHIADITAALFAISPWHLYISRLGHEANLGLSFFLFALYFFFISIEGGKYKRFMVISAFCFVVSLWAYQSEKIIIPLFILLLGVLYRKELINMKYIVISSSILACILIIPLVIVTLSPGALIRVGATSVFTFNPMYETYKNAWLEARKNKDTLHQILYSPKVTTIRLLATNYIIHFDPEWIFYGKPDERFKIPELGLIYWWEAIGIAATLFAVIKRYISKKTLMLLVIWLASGPIPAALTTEAPQAMRSYTALPVPEILCAIGIFFLIRQMKTQRRKLFVAFLWSIFFFGSLVYVSRQYFVAFPKAQSSSFQYALNHAMEYAIQNKKSYKKIVVSNERNLYQSYMFYLFESKFDPSTYLALGGTISGGYDKHHTIGPFEFRPIDWANESKTKGTLYLGNVKDFPPGVASKTFTSLDKKPAVSIVVGNL